MAAWLVQTRWMGNLHHAIEYGASKRKPERMGEEHARLRITDQDAGRGIAALVRENFPEDVPPPEVVYHGA